MQSTRAAIGLTVALLATVAVLELPLATAQSVFREDFEGAETTWRITAADARYRIDRHERVREPVQAGAFSEALTVSALDGTHIYFSRQIGAARIIDELRLSLAVLSDRTGLQLLARAVLPRSLDPQTGRPLTVLIPGPMIEKAGQWQRLEISQIPLLLERQIRILQVGRAGRIDSREGYIDMLALNVYGGRSKTQVWIDELTVSGFIEQGSVVRHQDNQVQPAAHAENESRPTHEVKLRGAVLLVDGRPFFPRLIEHRGEPLARLRELGFNGVKLFAPPDGALLAEAADTGLWIVCPPPPLTENPRIGRQYDSVLAWNLGDALTHQELPAIEATVRRLRDADRAMRRPIVAGAACELAAYSDLTDIMMMGRQALGTSLELSDHATWHQQRSRLMRPGAPAWAWIQTQCDGASRGQAAAFASRPVPLSVDHAALRHLALTAVATGARGVVFQSEAAEPGTPGLEQREASLRLLNLELSLIETWGAAGSFVTPATSSDPAITATVLQTDRARLLLPLRFSRGDQYVLDEAPQGDVTLIVPGVPESNDAFELTAAGLRPLSRRRVAGGMSVTLRDPAAAAMIVLTQDPLVIDSLTRAAAQQRRTAAELSRRLAGAELAEVETISRRLSGPGAPSGEVRTWLNSAKERMQQADRSVTSEDFPQALRSCRETEHWLGKLRREQWKQIAGSLPSAAAFPLAARYATLPECAALLPGLISTAAGQNLLPCGDFEDLEALRRAGWRNAQLPQRRVASDVALATDGTQGGTHCLRLRAIEQLGQEAPTLLEAPPAWITTPPVAVDPGTFVEIRGFVRVPRPITGSVDGLLIVDSLGGDALAERVGQTRGWQQFTLYRAAPRGGPVTVTFALSGLGEALIDDVTIRPITLPPPSAPVPASTQPTEPTATRPWFFWR